MRFDLDVLYELHYQMITLGKVSRPAFPWSLRLGVVLPAILYHIHVCSAGTVLIPYVGWFPSRT